MMATVIKYCSHKEKKQHLLLPASKQDAQQLNKEPHHHQQLTGAHAAPVLLCWYIHLTEGD